MSSAFGGKPGYKEFAYIYDSLMEDVDYNQWVAFILGIFGKYSFSCGSILDLGCGTGNVTIPLAQKGFSLVGVDASEDMLAIAKDKAMDKGLDILFIQQKIVQILDTFTELNKELYAELAARKKQYEYYLNKLLDFKEVTS